MPRYPDDSMTLRQQQAATRREQIIETALKLFAQEKNISIEKGEHLHIVAPSGRGKTSLMHFIYGLRKDYTGLISYDDADIKKLSPESFSSFRQKKISIIFQDLRLFPEQSVRENLEIKRMLHPYDNAGVIDEMAKRLGERVVSC